MAEDGSLVPWENASDSEKKGEYMGRLPEGWKTPRRVRGRTPNTRVEIQRIYKEDGILFTDGKRPLCGVLECTREECNREGRLNAEYSRAGTRWNRVPKEYIKYIEYIQG